MQIIYDSRVMEWHHYFMDMAKQAATRASCPRASVGCVLVKDRDIVSTGYNGSLPGQPHCVDVGCDIVDVSPEHPHGHCRRTVHAEDNAIARAAKHGKATNDCVAYITHKPCFGCFKTLISAGVTKIIYDIDYFNSELPTEYTKQCNILLVCLKDWEGVGREC